MDSDQEFDELRSLTTILLKSQQKSNDLTLIEKLMLKEQLRYCYYKLTKFCCPKGWSESDRASVLLLEMMQPELKFEVPTSRIRHKVCSCLTEEERAHNMEKVRVLALALANKEPTSQELENECQNSTPSEILIVDDSEEEYVGVTGANATESVDEQVTTEFLRADTIEELEAAAFPDLQPSSDEEEILDLPETLTDVSQVCELANGADPAPPIHSLEFSILAAQARYTNFSHVESILCDSSQKESPKRIRGVASVTLDSGQLTLIRPGRRTIMKNYDDTTTVSSFMKDIEDVNTRQDLYEHLCLYYWFKNVIRNKGVRRKHWLECPTILSRGDNSLQAISLRAVPITLLQFCNSMI